MMLCRVYKAVGKLFDYVATYLSFNIAMKVVDPLLMKLEDMGAGGVCYNDEE